MANQTALEVVPPIDDGDAKSLGPVLDFLRVLWAVDHGLQSVSKRMESQHGVTSPQLLVLRIVGLHPGIPAGRVAEILHAHPSTLTGILKRLQARALLQRKADPKDARRALLHLSAKGRRVSDPRSGLLEQAIRRLLHRLPHLVGPAHELLSAMAEELTTAAGKKVE